MKLLRRAWARLLGTFLNTQPENELNAEIEVISICRQRTTCDSACPHRKRGEKRS